MKTRKRAAKTAKSAVSSSGLLSPFSVSSPDLFSKPGKAYDLDIDFMPFASASASKKTKKTLTPSALPRSSVSPPLKTPVTISDLKDLVSARSNSLKKHLDLCHSEFVKEIAASEARISKRYKIQTQEGLRLAEESDKECKMISEKLNENMELMKASYAELITEAQKSASRVCKVSIPELAQSMEKAIEGLRSRCSKTPI